MSTLTLKGLHSELNLGVCLDDVDEHQLHLLKQCKKYIEEDLFAPTSHFHQKSHPALENAMHCIERLLEINPNKSEYHFLYAKVCLLRDYNK